MLNKAPGVWIGKFIDKMEYAYAAADVVWPIRRYDTCRANAYRKPAILVPYPHAAANHQELNAQALTGAGAAVMIKDMDLDAKALSTIKDIFLNSERQRSMSEKSLQLGKPNAGKEIAQRILALAFSKS